VSERGNEQSEEGLPLVLSAVNCYLGTNPEHWNKNLTRVNSITWDCLKTYLTLQITRGRILSLLFEQASTPWTIQGVAKMKG
jgi:hypothetical protein